MTEQITAIAATESTTKIRYLGRIVELPASQASRMLEKNRVRLEVMFEIHRHNWLAALAVAKSQKKIAKQAFWLSELKEAARHLANVSAMMTARDFGKDHVTPLRRLFIDELKATGWKPFGRDSTANERLLALRNALISCADFTFSAEVSAIREGRADGEVSLFGTHSIAPIARKWS